MVRFVLRTLFKEMTDARRTEMIGQANKALKGIPGFIRVLASFL